MSDQASTQRLSRWKGVGAALAAVGIVAVAFGFYQSPKIAIQSYFFGWYFWALVTLGCFGLLCLHNTVRGAWGTSILRMLEAGGGPEALLVCGLGGIPILMNLPALYPWANPDIVAHDHILQNKVWYLTTNGFMIRYVVYFVIWIGLAALLKRSSQKQDQTLEPKLGIQRNTIGPIGMVVFFISLTFAITDWVMSMEKYWFSSMLPMLTSVGAALTAFALAIVLLMKNRDSEPFKSIVTPQLTKDLGNLSFAMTMLWQYLTLSQYLITYAGNLPEEVPYYLKRNYHGWEYMIGGIILFQFFVPFTLLLFPRMKKYASNLMAIACLILFVRVFDVYWTVMPSLRSDVKLGQGMMGALQSLSQWQDYASFAMFAGLWFGVFGYQIAKAAVLPKHDTRLLEVVHAH